MQTCSKCGTPSRAGAPFCSTCGSSLMLGGMPAFPPPPKPPRSSGMAITGFVLSFVCGLLGLIFSLIGYAEIRKSKGSVTGGGFALAGIIISIVNIVLGLVIYLGFVRMVHDVKRAVQRPEARLTLWEIGDKAQRYYEKHGAFPTLSEPLHPSESCCESADSECPPSEWTGGWQQLEFEMYGSHSFRYSFKSTPDFFEARAVADLDCDGDEITYRLILDARDGYPRQRIEEPVEDD